MIEYRIDAGHLDGVNGSCDGVPGGNNSGCAMPIAEFGGSANGDENLDPRMLMPIQRAFIQ